MDMVAGVTRHMAGVTHHMAGATHHMAGAILIMDMGPTGQVIIVDTMMGIMAEADTDTIIPHLITLILKEVGATGMVTASPGQVIQDMVPGT